MIDTCQIIQLESSTACDGTCDFCPVNSIPLNRPKGTMKQALFEKIVREGMDMGVKQYLLFLNGEPLLFKPLFAWMDYLAERNLHTTLFTNASQLTAEKAQRLATHPALDFLTVSYHGGDKDTYERVMGLDYDKAKAQVEYFLSLNPSFPVKVYLLDYPETHASVEAFKATWGERAMVSAAYFSWGGLRPNPNKALELPPHPCERLLYHMTIDVQGKVNLCCMDYHSAVVWGDANTEPLADIWQQAQIWRDRHKALDFSMPLCKDCSMNRY